MRKRGILQSVVDLAMTVLLPLLMAYSLVGEAAHEWMGTAMLFLFFLHQVLHHRWYHALLRGPYHAPRVLHTVIDLLLVADLLLMGISGVLMSSHVFAFLHLSTGAATARAIHMPCAYWGFVLMSFHIGLHGRQVLGRIGASRRRDETAKPPTCLRILSFAAPAAISAYGVYAFLRRDFPDYLFLRTGFAFFDPGEPLALYLLDMVAIMVLFAALGYGCMKLADGAREADAA